MKPLFYTLLSAILTLSVYAQTFPQPELWLRDTAAQVITPATDSVLSYEVSNSLAYTVYSVMRSDEPDSSQVLCNVQDSLYLFCEQIGEDSTTISQIKNSPDAKIVRNLCSRMMNLSKYLVRMPPAGRYGGCKSRKVPLRGSAERILL